MKKTILSILFTLFVAFTYAQNPNPVMRIVFTNAANTDSDEVLYVFDNTAGYSANYVRGEDVSKLSGTTHSISSFSADNVALTADFRPVVAGRDSIRLAVLASSSGAYNLEFRNLSTIATFMLKDRKLDTLISVSNGMNYTFNILTTDTTTFGRNRFELVLFGNVTNLNSTILRSLVIYPNPSRNSFYISGINRANSIEVVDGIGRKMPVEIANSGEKLLVSHKLNPGIYFLSVNGKIQKQKIVVN